MDEQRATGMKKRRASRSHVYYKASLFACRANHQVKLRDVSPLGALVEGELALTVGDEVILSREELHLDCRVAWAKGRRAGLEFIDPPSPETVMQGLGRKAGR